MELRKYYFSCMHRHMIAYFNDGDDDDDGNDDGGCGDGIDDDLLEQGWQVQS